MKRRSFLKGLLAAAAIPLLPEVAIQRQPEVPTFDYEAILKKHYSAKRVESLTYRHHPFLDFLPKRR